MGRPCNFQDCFLPIKALRLSSKKRLGQTLAAFCCFTPSSNLLASVEFSLNSQFSDVIFNEVVESKIINQERGQINSSGFGLDYATGHWYFDFSYISGSGDLEYKGLTQGGFILATKTEYVITEFDFKVGYQHEQLKLFGGIGNEYRERNILGSPYGSGLYEEMDRYFYILGSEFHILDRKRFDVHFESQWHSSFKSDLTFEYAGAYESAQASMGEDWTWFSALKLSTHFGNHWDLDLIPSYRYTEIAPSETVPLISATTGNQEGSFYHPQSEWEAFSLELNLSFHF